jgi:LysM repeat protein
MRFVAPLAIVAFVIAFVVVLSSSGAGTAPGGGSSSPSATRTSSSVTTGKRSGSKFAHRRTYTVRTGDTLGAIAIKTGVSVSSLEDLNPGLDPQGLVAGQKLKLR